MQFLSLSLSLSLKGLQFSNLDFCVPNLWGPYLTELFILYETQWNEPWYSVSLILATIIPKVSY